MSSWRSIALLTGVCLAGGLQAQTARVPAQKIECQSINNNAVPPETYWTTERMEKARLTPLPYDWAPAGPGTGLRPGTCEPPPGYLVPTEISLQPYASAGRLFYSDGWRNFSCTAQFTGSGRTLLTAAHCVRSQSGRWYQDFYFVQGYDQGHGRPVRLKLVATWDKYSGGNTAYDYAFFYTDEPSGEGWLQLSTAEPPAYWLAIAYASNSEFGRGRLVQVLGGKGEEGLGVIQMLGNPMEGASGGAWIANAGMCSPLGNQVVGLTSSRSFENCQLNSPRFNGETRLLFQYVLNQCRP